MHLMQHHYLNLSHCRAAHTPSFCAAWYELLSGWLAWLLGKLTWVVRLRLPCLKIQPAGGDESQVSM